MVRRQTSVRVRRHKKRVLPLISIKFAKSCAKSCRYHRILFVSASVGDSFFSAIMKAALSHLEMNKLHEEWQININMHGALSNFHKTLTGQYKSSHMDTWSSRLSLPFVESNGLQWKEQLRVPRPPGGTLFHSHIQNLSLDLVGELFSLFFLKYSWAVPREI